MTTTTETRTLEIARTIAYQIEAGATGGSLLAAVRNKRIPLVSLRADETRLGGLDVTLRKGGKHYLYKVRIELTFDDLYRVKVFKINRRGFDYEVTYEVEGVYCDQLSEIVADAYNGELGR
jgi:hypothetical protein